MSDARPTPASVDRRDEASAEPAILEVENLTKIYPDGTLAVDDITFTVMEGDFAVIIGPSGCGKSTTLHSLVGKIEPTEGTIRLGGEDVTSLPAYERDIGLVFQDFQLFPHLTAEENARYGLEREGLESEEIGNRVDLLFDLMNLNEMRERLPKELSAGQKQRVALARSLVLEPKLLLLDEPLGDMDYKLQKRMEQELLRLHRQLDTTFVYVTHDQTQAMRLADQIIVMNDGKIEQSDSVNEVYNAPATAFVATFVGDSNIFYGSITDVSTDGERASVQTAYGTFEASTANLYSEPAALVGERIPFSVRPHYLRLDETAENTLECSLVDVIHQPGSGTQLILEATGQGGERRDLQLKSYEILDIDDDTVTAGWNPENTILLERTSVVEGIDLEQDILGE